MAPVSMTLSGLKAIFQGQGIIQRQITRKWYKIALGAVVQFTEYRTRDQKVAGSTHSHPVHCKQP